MSRDDIIEMEYDDNLPGVENCVGDSEVSEGTEEVIIAVLREEIHSEAMDSREGKAVETSKMEKPVTT